MLRIEDTEEDVDFLPRSPAEERLYEPRGVIGEGERELRLLRLLRILEWPVFNGRGWRGYECRF